MLSIWVDHKFSSIYCCTISLTHRRASMCQMNALVQASCEMGKNHRVCITTEEATCLSVCTPVHAHTAKNQKTPEAEDRREPLEISAGGTENARTSLGKGWDHVTEFLSIYLCRDFNTPQKQLLPRRLPSQQLQLGPIL